MAVYYKFKSAKDYDSIAIDGHFITVGHLKEKIFETKQLGRGKDFDLVVTNAQTNEEYLDEAMMVPKNTSVLIQRVPGRPRMNIVTQPNEPIEEHKPVDPEPAKSSYVGADSAGMQYPDDTEWDEFGNDLYAIPDVLPIQSSNQIMDAPPSNTIDEENKIRALIETPALDWQHQGADGFGGGRGFGRGMGGRMMNGRGFGRFGMEKKTPPPGYICHRCNVGGHLIQHCPTNGDPSYDVRKVKPPTGIPKSMLMATPDGSYSLPSGAVAVLRPNEAAFEKEIEGLPSTRYIGELPPEFHCPLCKEVMKDAVLTSKCCFKSFCDKCIRDYIISKSMCVCGATNILADDLLPNKTLRDTINRILESGNSSAENAGSTYQVQDMESARFPQPKIPSPSYSAASKGESMPPPRIEETLKMNETASEGHGATAPQHTSDKGRNLKVEDMSEATHDSMSVKEATSQGSAPLAEEEVQQKVASIDAGKKKKKKKVRTPLNAAEMQWMPPQDLPAENFMMPMGPGAYNPYWNGMQPGMDGFMPPYGGPIPYMGYGPGPLNMPFGNMMPHDPFGAQGGYMMPGIPPQRDLADFRMGFNAGPPIMSREEFEARKADLRRKRELERRDEPERRGESREFTKDREYARESSSIGEMKSKSKSGPQTSTADYHRHRHRSEKPLSERSSTRDLEPPPRAPKRKSSSERHDHYDQHNHSHHRSDSTSARPPSSETVKPQSRSSEADNKHKASVFSRISFPEGESSKKRKVSSSSSDHHKPTSNGYPEISTAKAVPSVGTRKTAVDYDYESSDDEDRHFKRKPSRYEPSPPPPVQMAEWEEEGTRRRSRSSRDRDRGGREYERDHGGYSKHR